MYSGGRKRIQAKGRKRAGDTLVLSERQLSCWFQSRAETVLMHMSHDKASQKMPRGWTCLFTAAAAAAKSLQSCSTLWDLMDCI